MVERWNPPRELSKQEGAIIKRLARVRKFLAFLRRHRHEIINEAFQAELGAMYRDTGAGKDPVAPGLMAMATLVQGYLGASDATMVELTVIDLSVQMVLDHLGAADPAFSQGAFSDFRGRFIGSDMDRRLLEHTVEIARRTKEFDWKKLSKSLRVAIDSKPLEGAGRVEDTLNLLGHAARNVVACAAQLLKWPEDKVCRVAGIPLLLAPSIKTALDLDWNDAVDKAEAIQILTAQLDSLQAWLHDHLAKEINRPPLKEHVATLEQLRNQDLEPDPDGGGVRIREGVAEDRRVSIRDPEMRHGRKSKTKRFNGFKQHIAAGIDCDLILACAVTPANRPEEEAGPWLQADIERQKLEIDELYIDRAYVNSTIVDDVLARRGEVLCKPWRAKNRHLFAKSAFKLDLRARSITCPAGQTVRFQLGTSAEFDPDVCDHCPLRAQCTTAELGQGRTVSIAENEQLQQRLRKQVATPSGRARLRKRTNVEHRLAHIARRQGRRARYVGVRKNTFDLRRAAAIQNIEAWQRRIELPQRKVA
jgi:Transposase DDE domain